MNNNVKLIHFDKKGDNRGFLVVVEQNKDIPIEI
ncbi:dTDP-6-deoxy-3,4-keto-hexulose isomerase, partial [Escherichia coli]|nr:dTDP-6-deoxy-3,4-keto-hexulose isomerase [Escherichia coli]